MISSLEKNQKLSLFALIMINVMAVDSLRTLPISAKYGYALVFYYLLAALLFFIPSAFATAELSSHYPQTGGIYIWVRRAFGERWAFVSIWLQWLYNVCWYPTIIALVAVSIAYWFDPALSENKYFMIISMITIYTLLTLVNFFGLYVSSRIINLSAIFGTLLPMLCIIILGAVWLYLSKPIAISLTKAAFLPDLFHLNQWVLFMAVLYGLVGIDMSAIHAADVIDPMRTYPKALWISVIIILLTLILSSLAIAIVVPQKELSLIAGLLQAFTLFFDEFHMQWVKPYISGAIVIGAIGSVVAWIIGPAKGLMIACEDGCLPIALAKQNRYGVPYRLLAIQWLLFVLLTLIFILLPSVNAAFWLLTDITSQLALLSYAFLFAALIKLDKENQTKKSCIPGGRLGILIVGGIGFILSIAAVLLGFVPPNQIAVGSLYLYECIILLGLFFGFMLPLLLFDYFKVRV